MVVWTEIDVAQIEAVAARQDRSKYNLNGGPLRFQVPRGMCTWGVSAYKSFQIDLSNQKFMDWWRALERQLLPQVMDGGAPFNSNLKGATLRIKIDEATYIFDKESTQVSPEVREGLFRGQELSCLIDVESSYFYNGNWGLTVRAYQVKYYGEESGGEEPASAAEPTQAWEKGSCAFLTESEQ